MCNILFCHPNILHSKTSVHVITVTKDLRKNTPAFFEFKKLKNSKSALINLIIYCK